MSRPWRIERGVVPQNEAIAIFAATILIAMASSTHALDIVFTDVGATAMTQEQLNAFEAAGALWEARFSDPIEVKINVAFDLASEFETPNVLGSTSSQLTTHPWSTVRACLVFDADDAIERDVMTQLPATGLDLQDINGDRSDTMVTMTTANAKALMIGTTPDALYGLSFANNADGRIRFNAGYDSQFDYDPADGVDDCADGLCSDFVATAAHEIGHLLGFSSQTDIQDLNEKFELHPRTLDVWRFPDANRPHPIASELRLMTAGAAEYYDTILENEDFSWGVGVTDPQCSGVDNLCQASHWRDEDPTRLLLDPVENGADLGTSLPPQVEDHHALDYIGYNLEAGFPTRRQIESGSFRVAWAPAEEFGQVLEDPPVGTEGPADFDPNLGAQIEFDFDIPGLDGRAALGVARFEAPEAAGDSQLTPLPYRDGEQNLFPPSNVSEMLPARLTDFVFRTDDGNAEVTFIDTFSVDGSGYDAALGGYLVSGLLGGSLDGDPTDVDAAVHFVLLTNDATPDPDTQNVFSIGSFSEFDTIAIYDEVAFGIANDPDCNGDGVVDFNDVGCVCVRGDADEFDAFLQEIGSLRGDADGNGEVDFGDFLTLADNFGTEGRTYTQGDFDCDAAVQFSDFLILAGNFGQRATLVAVPEPSVFVLSTIVLMFCFLRRNLRRQPS